MQENDIVLIQRTLEGDERAFTALVNKYQKWVHTLVWRKIGDFHIAEEITQDVFLKVYKKLATLKLPENFPGWLYVIAARHCISWFRKKRQPTTSLDAMPTTELEELCYTQYETAYREETSLEHRRELVKRLLQKLPESERTVITLYYLAEMTSDEISAFLGVSPNTIRSRLRRARKRLEKQEHLLHDVSGIFQLPPTLTESIIQEIARIKPITPSVGRPWVPWTLSFSATLLVILMMGLGPRALSRFQQPYSLDTTSEMTVELIDAPMVLDVKRKPDVKNRFGNTDVEGRGKSTVPRADTGLLAAAQADTPEVPKTEEPQWIPAKGPGGAIVGSFFVTSRKEVYALGGTRLYRLADKDSTEWILINATLPFTNHGMPMAEGKDALYVVTETDLLTSTNGGTTLQRLSSRPPGRAIALLIPSRLRWSQNTQTEMYLVLTDGVFRSMDAGNTWYAFNDGLNAPEIQDAVVVENILFLGTKQGLYRRNSDVWEKLPVAQSQSIDSLAVAGDRIYLNAGKQEDQESGSIFVSSDFGESWTDITPTDRRSLFPLTVGSVKLVAIGETVLALGVGVLRSRDAGDTWEYLGFQKEAFMLSILPAAALDEDTFFISTIGEVRRSIDGGSGWHLFTAGMSELHILDLVQANNAIYAVTNTGVAKSSDGGNRWTQIDTNLPLPSNKSLGDLKLSNLTAVGNSLYVRAKQGGSTNCLLHLLPNTDTLLHIEGMPVYVDSSHGEWLERTIRASTAIGLSKADRPDLLRYQLGIEEAVVRTTGEFAIGAGNFYIEYERKLYRWTPKDRKWHDTGMQDAPVFADFYATDGFQFAVSGKVIYLGKSDGSLFQSLNGGDTWKDITADFPFPLNRAESQDQLLKKLPHFKEIIFVQNTVYVSTNDGVAMSNDGENWHVLTDSRYAPMAMLQLAVDGTGLYGVSQTGAYQLNKDTGIWEQITSGVPGRVTSLTVARNTLYIGTEHRGILRFPLRNL